MCQYDVPLRSCLMSAEAQETKSTDKQSKLMVHSSDPEAKHVAVKSIEGNLLNTIHNERENVRTYQSGWLLKSIPFLGYLLKCWQTLLFDS